MGFVMNIILIIEPLRPFLNEPRITPIMHSIMSRLDCVSNDEVAAMRTALVALLSESESEEDNTALMNTIHAVLIDLAKKNPINDEDYMTLTAIPDAFRVVCSLGYQFEIKCLVEYHTHRACRENILGERYDSKWLINPVTNQRFSLRDQEYIPMIIQNASFKAPENCR